jgi:hypothetical protein
MWASDDQRLLIGLLAAAHDGDELGFAALLNGVPRAGLRMVIRSLVEVVVAGQLAAEDEPGAARECLAREALNLAAKIATGPPSSWWSANAPHANTRPAPRARETLMCIPETSTQYMFLPVYGPPGVDLTWYPVQVALVPEDAGEPAPSAYQAAAWMNGQAPLLIGAGPFPPGDYMAWVLVGGREALVIQSGRIRIGDGISPAGTPGAPAATWVTSINGQVGAVVIGLFYDGGSARTGERPAYAIDGGNA